MWRHGHFHWNELMTRDAESAKAFYEKTLGWTFNGMPMPTGTYWVAVDGEDPIAGIMTMDSPDFEGVPEHWFAYIAVDDVDARTADAEAAGAKILTPPFDVPQVGRIVIIQQPDGGRVGWMTPAS